MNNLWNKSMKLTPVNSITTITAIRNTSKIFILNKLFSTRLQLLMNSCPTLAEYLRGWIFVLYIFMWKSRRYSHSFRLHTRVLTHKLIPSKKLHSDNWFLILLLILFIRQCQRRLHEQINKIYKCLDMSNRTSY